MTDLALILHATLLASLSIVPITASRWRSRCTDGRATFERLCARCHGGDGRGGEMGPGIVARLALRDRRRAVGDRARRPAGEGMPGLPLPDAELRALVTFLRTLRPGRSEAPPRLRATLADGGTVDGVVLNQTAADLQVLGRRRPAAPAAAARRRLAPRHVAGGLADLPRRSRRQPLQRRSTRSTRPPSAGWRPLDLPAARTRPACR